MTTPSVQSILKKHGIQPKKRLGQHFLSPMPTIEKIVAALGTTRDDKVIEIGPGLGVMTSLVARDADHVYAIDKDAAMIDVARAEFGDIENITWVEEDILNVPLCEIVQKLACVRKGERIRVIGNLPYNISSPILFCMLDHREMIARAVIMIQKEVADRIVAKPGGKEYGILSVLTQAFADCTKLFNVSAKSFIPPPEVTSAVLRIDFKEGNCGIEDEARFRAIVKGAFGKRRKTLRNALIGARDLKLDQAKLDDALADAAIDPRRRPETLSVEEFVKLANLLK